MAKFEDLTGETYGRLTVISRAENKGGFVYWNCRCTCKSGKVVTVRAGDLKSQKVLSCGCLNREKTIERETTHGKSHDKIYHVWQGIKDRCTNANCKQYPNYGGRGIKLYPAWEEFQPFYDYVSTLEHFGEKGYSLDRIDNNGNYEPDNLRWADRKTQNRNKTNNHLVEYQGELITLAEAAELSGIKRQTLQGRLKRGWAAEDLFKPVEERRRKE